jgi:CMP-N,N'-diacetyllegionaminic acid synthase
MPDKNVEPLAGHPLIAWAIAAGVLCEAVDRVVVTTDSPDIAELAHRYGAEVPFLRPDEFARDDSPDIDFVRHALESVRREDVPDLIVLLRPTTPLRDPALVSAAVQAIVDDSAATALRSLQTLAEPPQKMVALEDGYLTGFFPQDPRPEYYNLPRQAFPQAYLPNGYVDVVRAETVLEAGVLFGPRVRGFVTPAAVEVDRPEDFDYLAFVVERDGHPFVAYLDDAASRASSPKLR